MQMRGFSTRTHKRYLAAVYDLARYNHHIAISDGQILSIEGDLVKFRYNDYADKNREKVLSLSGEEYIRRFLLQGQACTRGSANAVAETDSEAACACLGYPCPECHIGRFLLSLIAILLILRRS
jgi:hypothetical protein